MPNDNFNALLSQLPSIAEAVNQFGSEATQVIALESLLVAFGASPGKRSSTPQKQRKSPQSRRKKPTGGEDNTASGKSKRHKKEATKLKVVKDLDLRPEGKKSLDDFLKEKRPKNQVEQITVILYYLQNVLKLPTVTADHIYTCFKTTHDLRIPGNMLQSLRNTSHRLGSIDTSNMGTLELTAAGENYVDHDLPREEK